MLLDAKRVDALLFHPLASLVLGDILFSIPEEGYASVGGEYLRISPIELNAGDTTEALTRYCSIHNFLTAKIPIFKVVLIQDIHFFFIAILKILHDVGIVYSIPIEYTYLVANSIASA